MNRKTLTKTEILNEAREKRLKEDLSPKRKNRSCGKTYKYVGRRFIDLSYVSKCVKKKYHWPIMKTKLC